MPTSSSSFTMRLPTRVSATLAIGKNRFIDLMNRPRMP